MTRDNLPHRREAIEAIRLALSYLDHPEVKRIPFAIPSGNIVKPALRALDYLAGDQAEG